MGFSPSQLDLLSMFKIKVLHLDSFFEQVSMQCQAPDVQNRVHQEFCPWEAYYIDQNTLGEKARVACSLVTCA